MPSRNISHSSPPCLLPGSRREASADGSARTLLLSVEDHVTFLEGRKVRHVQEKRRWVDNYRWARRRDMGVWVGDRVGGVRAVAEQRTNVLPARPPAPTWRAANGVGCSCKARPAPLPAAAGCPASLWLCATAPRGPPRRSAASCGRQRACRAWPAPRMRRAATRPCWMPRWWSCWSAAQVGVRGAGGRARQARHVLVPSLSSLQLGLLRSAMSRKHAEGSSCCHRRGRALLVAAVAPALSPAPPPCVLAGDADERHLAELGPGCMIDVSPVAGSG